MIVFTLQSFSVLVK